MSTLIQFAIGLLFGTGLVVAGMADPAKVLNFLDIAAMGTTWDPSLAFVMGGAVLVTLIGYPLVRRRERPLLAGSFHALPTQLDGQLVTGAAVFGIGWGLAGFCPGPAFTALGVAAAGGASFALVVPFVAAMLVGVAAARWLGERNNGAGSSEPVEVEPAT
jgi:uncharacterized protein